MDKICRKCNIKKQEHYFYKHSQMKDGHLNICVECIKSNVRARYFLNHEESKKKERERNKRRLCNPLYKKYKKEYDLKNREQIKKTQKIWRKKNRMIVLEYHQRYIKNNRNKRIAHNKLNGAIRSGSIKAKKCFCGEKAHAHHPDYSKPLDVIWLCPKHHKEKHRKE